MSDIGEVIKKIVHDEEHFPDYRIPKNLPDELRQGKNAAPAG
jgi:hypothetical protein